MELLKICPDATKHVILFSTSGYNPFRPFWPTRVALTVTLMHIHMCTNVVVVICLSEAQKEKALALLEHILHEPRSSRQACVCVGH